MRKRLWRAISQVETTRTTINCSATIFILGIYPVDLETFQITAVLNFEFWYIAPAQFLNSPPPWLTLKEPWEWDQNDEEEYKVKLRSYTKIMEEEEEVSGRDHSFSYLMQRYMDDGTFWYNLAVRKSLYLSQLMKHCWAVNAM